MNETPVPETAPAGGYDAPPGAEAWLARVAIAGPIVEAAAADSDRARRLTDAAMAALHEQRLFRLLLPRGLGGEEISLPVFFAVVEAVARHDASAAWCVCQGNGCAMLGAYLDKSVGEAIWAGDPAGVLAWGPGKAEARAVDGGYEVTARSVFVSGVNHATWLAAHCTVLENDGTPRLGAEGVAENRTCLFPAGATSLTENWDVIGLRGTGSDSFATDGLFVPDDHTIVRATMIEKAGIEKAGIEKAGKQSALYELPQMSVYAIGFAATALGIAGGFIDTFVELAQEKRPRLVTSPIKDNPVVQDEVARASARWSSARAFLVAETERGWHEAETAGRISVAQRMRIRLAATHAIHEAKAAVDTLFDTAGTSAVFASSPFERRLRDIHTVALQIQGRKTHFQTYGAWMLGHPADMAVI